MPSERLPFWMSPSYLSDGVVHNSTVDHGAKGSLVVGSREAGIHRQCRWLATVIEAKSSEFFDDSGGSDGYWALARKRPAHRRGPLLALQKSFMPGGL
jgi:hypothetical protein